MGVANALTIWILLFRESSHHTMMENILGMKHGVEQVTKTGYYNFHKSSLNAYKYFNINELADLPMTYTKRVQSTVLMASDANAIPLLLNGYDIENELKLSKLSTLLPKDFRLKKSYGLLLGKRIADLLSLNEGSEVAVIGQAIDGSVANEIFTVEKVIDLGGGEFEKNFAVTRLDSMQAFLSLPQDQVHLIINYGNHFSQNLPQEMSKIKWQEILPDIASSSAFMEKFTRFYAFFFAVVASLALANSLSLSFLERVKEYRMSTIIGAPVEWLRRAMILEITIISLASIILGNLLILMVSAILHFYPINLSILTGGAPLQIGGIILTQDVKIIFEGWIFIASNLFLIFTLSLASLYPIKVILKKAQKV